MGDHGSDGLTIEYRLRDRMIVIAKDIEACSATCDGFQKKKLVGECFRALAKQRTHHLRSVKVFKSLSWETKLGEFATVFEDHKEALHKDLAMHASLGISQANQTLGRMEVVSGASSSKLNLLLLFQELRSPEERELRKFIESKGGAEVFLNDEALMRELIERSDNEGDHSIGAQMKLTKDLQRDLRKDLEELINDNQEVFSNKFTALQDNIRTQMETTMAREGDRIIGTILAGPHDRLIDPVSVHRRPEDIRR